VTVSESTKQDLLELGFSRIFVVPEGLNFKPLTSIPAKEKYPIFVYVGRLKRAKRPDHAIKAFKIIKKRIPEVELWIIGDGPFKADLKKMAGKGVRFFSNLNNFERRERLRKSWVLVNPSVREGWGLNVIEANALGVPAIAYSVHGLRDSIKHLETGLLAKAGDINDLASQTINILKSQTLRERLSRNALKFTTEFNWNKTAKEFINIMK
jgi:glycosyltransferase involved in cell wall biosynthesis